MLLPGCRGLSTATIPAQDRTVNYEPADTTRLDDVPPVPVDGVDTEPLDVTVYEDTASSPTVNLESIEIDRSDPDNQVVTTRVRAGSTTVEKRFTLNVMGETFRAFADSSGLEAVVSGDPITYETKVERRSIDHPWYVDLWRNAKLILALAVGGGLVLLAVLRGLP